ncbi:MAG: amidase [Gammaproteobacteria bacterium]|nr:amidase [Gammaproteobacteria bacterium]
MSDIELCYLNATEALRRFKRLELSPVELMQAVIDRAEAVEPTINAFTDTYFERALERARAAEVKYAKGVRTRPLEGIPVVIKDEHAIKGERTTSGSLIFKDNVEDETSACVERIIRAGAIIHARSAAPEFSCAAITHSKLWGVTRNPWNPKYTPGGSSGGSAAALTAGTTTLANGSDIGGSIRIPASCCGVVGFKPPYGRVPVDPPFNLDAYCHEGPLARNVMDAALLENVIAGPHSQDITTLRPKLRIPDRLEDIKGWKIAYSIDLGYVEVDDEVVANTEAMVGVLRQLGAEVEQVDLGWTWSTLTAAWNHLAHLFGNYIAKELERHRYEMTDYARAFAEFGRTTTADDFLAAKEVEGEMYASLGPVLERYHALICPTLALPAVAADHDSTCQKVVINGVSVEPALGWCMTYPFNMMSRCPVMSVPSGHASNGVPTGLQIVGRTYDDVGVFRIAAALERARPGYELAANRPKL